MNDDLQQRLEALGSVGPPPISDARLDAIEARAMQATLARPERRRSALLVLAAAAAVILLVGGVLFAAGGGDSGTLRLVAADGVTVEFGDERTADGVEGLVLGEGDVVDIRLGGSAIVGSDRFGPGRYQVVDGRLRPLAAVTSSTSIAPSVTPAATTTTISARDRERDLTGPSTAPPVVRPRPTSTRVPADRERTDRPATTVVRRPTTTTIRTTTPRPTTTTTVTQATDGRRSTTTTSAPARSTTTAPSTTVVDRTTLVDRPTTTAPATTAPATTTTTMVLGRDRP